jgi:hypothetical protein
VQVFYVIEFAQAFLEIKNSVNMLPSREKTYTCQESQIMGWATFWTNFRKAFVRKTQPGPPGYGRDVALPI